VRFIAVIVSRDDVPRDRSHDDDDGALNVAAAGDDGVWPLMDSLHLVVIKLWIFVDVLLLVRRLSLLVFAVRGLHIQPENYDIKMTSQDRVTWSPSVDQTQQPLATRHQNGGLYCVASDVIVTKSRDPLRSSEPEVVRAVADVSLVYIALGVGAVCLLAVALCACAAMLDHFLSTVARGSFLLPVSMYFRSAVEFLVHEARHLTSAGAAAVDQRFQLIHLQHIITLFNRGHYTTAISFLNNLRHLLLETVEFITHNAFSDIFNEVI